ncbi:MAG: hypothetical protein QOD69_800 [Solirubrobacteraceae bacterium]|jgi:hypothetical protein|nr:hypothetical protein [Solirubrobacteraceae bacterium]
MSPNDDQPYGDVRGLVEARLGRPPQDRLEAAVVLEAWGGVRPPHGLEIAGAAVDAAHGRPARSVANPGASQPRDPAIVAEGLALLVAIVAVALWTRPFGRALGTTVWDDAVRLALPITLGGQWLLRSRYLERPGGLAILRRDGIRIVCLLGAGCAAATQGESVLFAVLLTVTWVGGAVLIRRGWGLLYVTLLVAVAIDVNLGGDPRGALAAAAAATLLLAIVIVATAGATTEAPGRPRRAAAAGLIGAGIGGLLVLDTSVGWGAEGVLPALALVPSTAGSFWGGYHLWRFYDVVPRALAGVPVEEADRATWRSPALAVLGGALGRLVGATLVLSALALLAATHVAEPQTAAAAGRIALLGGFGLVALATLLLSLQHSLGFSSWTLFTLACALVAEAAVTQLDAPPFAGIALVTGAAVAVALAIPPVIGLFLRPGRVLATILWIS